MELVANLITNDLANFNKQSIRPCNSSANDTHNNELPPDALNSIQEIFTKLAVIYGAWSWESFLGNEFSNIVVAKSEWWKELKRFTAKEISFALAICRRKVNPDGTVYPPKLPEFVNYCKMKRERIKHKNSFFTALPKPPVDIEKGRQEIAKIRALLKKHKKYA